MLSCFYTSTSSGLLQIDKRLASKTKLCVTVCPHNWSQVAVKLILKARLGANSALSQVQSNLGVAGYLSECLVNHGSYHVNHTTFKSIIWSKYKSRQLRK